MKVVFTLMLLLSFSSASFCQAPKDEKEVDDKTFKLDKKTNEFADASGFVFKLEKVKSQVSPLQNNYYFCSQDGKRMVLFAFRSYVDPAKMDRYNPQGNVNYYEVTFPGTDIPACEITFGFIKKIAKNFYERKIISKGKLDLEAAKAYSQEAGMHISYR